MVVGGTKMLPILPKNMLCCFFFFLFFFCFFFFFWGGGVVLQMITDDPYIALVRSNASCVVGAC